MHTQLVTQLVPVVVIPTGDSLFQGEGVIDQSKDSNLKPSGTDDQGYKDENE